MTSSTAPGTGSHGYATLRASMPHFDWPDPEAALDRILSRYAPAISL
jgi:hypothetical protein